MGELQEAPCAPSWDDNAEGPERMQTLTVPEPLELDIAVPSLQGSEEGCSRQKKSFQRLGRLH